MAALEPSQVQLYLDLAGGMSIKAIARRDHVSRQAIQHRRDRLLSRIAGGCPPASFGTVTAESGCGNSPGIVAAVRDTHANNVRRSA
jgi:hypothetical protein